MTNSTINIVLADDHQIVLDGIKTLLMQEDNLHILGAFTNGSEAVQYCQNHHVDVALLDINMPILNGIDACEAIVSTLQTKVIALTNHQELAFIYRMLNAGAHGYLLKSVDRKTLVNAINAIYNGQTFFCPDVRRLLISMDSYHNVDEDEKSPRLSRREKEILKLIIHENTTKEIASQLFIGQSTVDTHRKNLLKKLRVKNTAGLVRLAYETNLLAV